MDRRSFRIERGVECADPYQQTNLLPLERTLPDKNCIAIENAYCVEGVKVFCHICGSCRHNNGYTGAIDGGRRILFGSTCARSYFSPEVLAAAKRNHEIRFAKANAQFNVEAIKGVAFDIQNWIKSNEKMILQVARAWSTMTDDHNDFIQEVFDHLDKNNSRLTQDYVEEASDISKEAGRHGQLVTKRIVIALRVRLGS